MKKSPLLCGVDPLSVAITRHPSPINTSAPPVSEEEKIATIATHFEQIMRVLGLDLTDPSLAKTPLRVAKMYVRELFSGLNFENFPPLSFIEDPGQGTDSDRMISLKMGFTSFCEHHFVPMLGHVYLAYLPNGRLLGLSKFSRIVRYFARRPQIQERFTAQIADALSMLLETENVAVYTKATHFCVIARGVEDENSSANSLVLRGDFKDNSDLRKQFLQEVHR